MSTTSVPTPALPRGRARRGRRVRGAGAPGGVALGVAVLWLSVIVLLPMAALVAKSTEGDFWSIVTSRQALNALELTVGASLVVAIVNSVMGTLIAWVLVRDEFPGRRIVDALVDLPFALPTVVAGLTLFALYGHTSPWHLNLEATKASVVLAMAFVTLPFVVRSVQPVLMEVDTEMEEAAASLGATPWVTFRRVILPNLRPAILSGAALSFARAVGEYGSLLFITRGIPNQTQVSSIFIFKQQESDNLPGAAAVSVVLLAVSLAVLIVIRLAERRGQNRG